MSTSGTPQVTRDLAAIEARGVSAERSLGSSMKSVGSSLSTAGKTMSTFVTLPMAGLGAGMVKLAADAGESASKMEAVFGNATGGMNKWIGELRKTVPATTTELQGMSSSIQDLLVPLGMAPKEAKGLTKEVVTLAGDLASFNNIPMDEALEKIRSGMVGQYEPLLDFGVALSADTVKAEALRMGLIKEGQELDANSRAQAALSLTMKGTTAAHGDAAKTAGSAANSFKFLWSQVKELGATLGKNLLPIITPVVQKMAALAGRMGELSPKWQAVILGVGAFVAALGPLLLIVGTVVSALGSLMLATGATTLGAAFGLAAAAVGSFLVAAAPFIAVAAAMAGAAFLIYKNWASVAPVFYSVANAIGGALSSAWSVVSQFVGGMIQAGSQVISGFAGGIYAGAGAIANALLDTLISAFDAALSWLGIASPSKRAFEMGRNTGQGYADGLAASIPEARDGVVRLGEVTEEEWQKLQDQGWKGVPGDNKEQIYSPENQDKIARGIDPLDAGGPIKYPKGQTAGPSSIPTSPQLGNFNPAAAKLPTSPQLGDFKPSAANLPTSPQLDGFKPSAAKMPTSPQLGGFTPDGLSGGKASSLPDAMKKIGENAGKGLSDGIASKVEEVKTKAGLLFSAVTDRFAGLREKLGPSVKRAFGYVKERAEAAKTWVVDNWPDLKDSVVSTLEQAASLARPQIVKLFDYLKTKAQSAITWFKQNWPKIKTTISSGAGTAGQSIKSGLGAAFSFVVTQGQRLIAWFKQNWPKIKTTTLTVIKAVASALRTGLGAAFRFIVTQGKRLITWTRENWPQIKTTVLAVVKAVGSAVRTVLGGAFKFALQNGKIIVNWFKQNWPLIQRTVQTVMKILASRIRTGFNLLKSIIFLTVKAIVEFWKRNWTEIKAILQSVWRIIKSVVQTAIKNVLNILKLGMQVLTGDWRGAWKTVKTILSDNWENIKTIVREALRILVNVLTIHWNNIKAFTKAAFNAVRDYIESRLEEAKTRATEILRNLGQAVFDRYEAMKRSAKAAFEAIKGFMVNPIESAYNGIKDWVEKILDVVNTVLKAMGLDEIKLGSSVESPGGNGSSGRGSRPARVARFAKGGMAREHRMGRFAKGGLGTSSPQPRTHMWNEQMGNEAYIAEKRPAKEQLPYLQTAADWHGYAVVPSNPSLIKNFKHDDTTFARGGLAGVPTVPFAIGGETTASGQAMHSAVKEKFGVDGFNRHGSYLSQPGASRSIDWMVTTPGNRAEGSQKTLGDNIASFVSPPSTRATIWYGQANYGGGWQGYSTGPGMGNSNTLGHYDHVHGEALADSFKGAQGTAPTGGGGIGGAIRNLALDKFNKMWDATVQPIADKFLKPLKDADYVLKNAVGAAGQKIPDGIKEWATKELGLSGGDGGSGTKFTGGGSAAENRKLGERMLGASGVPGSFSSLASLWQKESEWNHKAQNPTSTASGIPQFLDQTWAQYGGKSTDPPGQIEKGLKYIKDRYGGTDAAWQHSQANNWYSEGGMTNGAQNAVIGEAGPELVLPLSSARVMQSAQTALGVSQLHEEVRGMREDMKNLRVNVGDIETPAADKLIVTQEHTAKRILNGRDGLNATKKHQSSINKVLDLSGNRTGGR